MLVICGTFSSKSVNFYFCQKYPIKELHPDGKESLWDARTGFTVPTHLISYAGVVSCQTHIGNETFKSPLYIVAVVGKISLKSSIISSHFNLLLRLLLRSPNSVSHV